MLGAKKAYTIGGKEAIPGDLESDSGPTRRQVIQRVYGDESQDTSMACADKIAEHDSDPKRMPRTKSE